MHARTEKQFLLCIHGIHRVFDYMCTVRYGMVLDLLQGLAKSLSSITARHSGKMADSRYSTVPYRTVQYQCKTGSGFRLLYNTILPSAGEVWTVDASMPFYHFYSAAAMPCGQTVVAVCTIYLHSTNVQYLENHLQSASKVSSDGSLLSTYSTVSTVQYSTVSGSQSSKLWIGHGVDSICIKSRPPPVSPPRVFVTGCSWLGLVPTAPTDTVRYCTVLYHIVDAMSVGRDSEDSLSRVSRISSAEGQGAHDFLAPEFASRISHLALRISHLETIVVRGWGSRWGAAT